MRRTRNDENSNHESTNQECSRKNSKDLRKERNQVHNKLCNRRLREQEIIPHKSEIPIPQMEEIKSGMLIFHRLLRRSKIQMFASGVKISVKFFPIESKSTLYCIFNDTAYYYFRVTKSDVTI